MCVKSLETGANITCVLGDFLNEVHMSIYKCSNEHELKILAIHLQRWRPFKTKTSRGARMNNTQPTYLAIFLKIITEKIHVPYHINAYFPRFFKVFLLFLFKVLTHTIQFKVKPCHRNLIRGHKTFILPPLLHKILASSMKCLKWNPVFEKKLLFIIKH